MVLANQQPGNTGEKEISSASAGNLWRVHLFEFNYFNLFVLRLSAFSPSPLRIPDVTGSEV